MSIVFSPQFRLHFIIFLWGFTAIIGKLISLEAMHLVWYRVLITLIILFFIAIYKKDLFNVSIKLVLQLLISGTVIALHWFFFFHSIKVSNVSIALASISTGALFTALFEPLFFKRKIKFYEILLSLVITICIIIIFNAEIKYYEGIIYGLICSSLSALFSVLNGKFAGKTSSVNIIFYELLGGFILLNVLLLTYFLPQNLFLIGWKDFLYIFLLGSLFTAYPMLESIKLMKYITPFTLMLTVNLEPIYGIILAYLFWQESESMSAVFYITTFVMLSVIILNGILKSNKKSNEQVN